MFVFVGTCVVLPLIVGYTVFAYRVFWGKARSLTYDAYGGRSKAKR